MSIKHWLHEARLLLGIERSTTRHGEKLISGVGAFLGILAVYWGTRWCFPEGFMHTAGTLIMVTSMGATAVLLFAVPQGALSQPWAVIGGHLLSAFVGVTVQQLVPDQSWTPALAVGLAVGIMHYLRCMQSAVGMCCSSRSAIIKLPRQNCCRRYRWLPPFWSACWPPHHFGSGFIPV